MAFSGKHPTPTYITHTATTSSLFVIKMTTDKAPPFKLYFNFQKKNISPTKKNHLQPCLTPYKFHFAKVPNRLQIHDTLGRGMRFTITEAQIPMTSITSNEFTQQKQRVRRKQGLLGDIISGISCSAISGVGDWLVVYIPSLFGNSKYILRFACLVP